MNLRNKPDSRAYYYLMIVLLFLCACKDKKRMQTISQIVTEWIGKEIQFPAEIPCQSLGRDTICINPHNSTSYKILLYVDSTGCNSCRLKLSEWRQLITEIDSLFPEKTDFLIFYQPKNSNIRELAFQMNLYDFHYPVFMDVENQINKANRFPSDPGFQCFLLDKDNKVVLIGNPITNFQIRELYKQQIGGEKKQITPITTIQANAVRQDFPNMKMGETYSCVFEIENTGDNPFVILGINSSCGCTVPTWDSRPVAPGGKTEIRVEVKPESTGFFNKTIDVYGNIAQSVLKLSIIGMVE